MILSPPGRASHIAQVSTLAVAVGVAIGSPAAQAYEFTIDVRTIGQGYQVRRYAPSGGNDLLTRRRLTQYLNLNITDIEPDRWRDPQRERNTLFVDVSLRFDSDFGGYLLGRPTGSNEIRELQQSQVDVLYAFLGGRAVGGRVDFQLGRQMHYDLVDFYAFDGADVTVRLRRDWAVEGFAGTEVRGDLPVSSPMYQLDGTSIGSQDPATRPAQANQLRPLVGAAVTFDSAAAGTARLAYRRVWSPTADRLPGEPATAINDEKLALTASGNWRQRLYLTAGLRYNLLVGLFDDQQVGLRLRLSPAQWLTTEYVYLAPTFDGDSIWNVFSTGAYRDLRATYETAVADGVRFFARGFFRHFEETAGEVVAGADLGAQAPGGRWAAGGSGGLERRQGRAFMRGDGYFEDGLGGRKAGGDFATRFVLQPRKLELEGRLTGFWWRQDLQPDNHTGVVFGAQAGARFQIAEGMYVHLLAEDNVGTFYRSQYRGLAVFEVDAAL